jgi:hypothetical protein
MCIETKRIIKSRDVVFVKGTKKVEGVHHNRPLPKQVKHVVVDEVVNDDELVKDQTLFWKNNLLHHKMRV